MSRNEPRAFPKSDELYPNGTVRQAGSDGMSLRQHYAGKIIAGFCANPAVFVCDPRCGWKLVNVKETDLTDYAFKLADAMIQAERTTL